MALNTDWKEFLSLCASSGVEFIIVGAWARALHGEPRMTGDIDLFVRPSEANAESLVKVIADFGFASLGLRAADFTDDSQVIQLGYPPRRIDILTGLSGLDFERAWKNRLETTLDGIPVAFLSREDFIANKIATGRPKDLADIEALVEADGTVDKG